MREGRKNNITAVYPEHRTNLMNNSRRDISKAKVWVWHVTTIDFPQTNAKTVDVTFPVVWFTIKNLLIHTKNREVFVLTGKLLCKIFFKEIGLINTSGAI